MRIGVFGGSFNPPHKMHLKIGLDLLNNNYLDKIIYVPTGSKYKYKNNLFSDIDRLNMLKLMTCGDDRFAVSDFELKDREVYTYETLDYFKNIYVNDEIYFICGTDNLSYIDLWKNGFYLLENYKFLVVKRYTDPIDNILNKLAKYRDNIIISNIEMNSLSSTEVREKLKNREDISDLLDDDVINYIEKNNLYN